MYILFDTSNRQHLHVLTQMPYLFYSVIHSWKSNSLIKFKFGLWRGNISIGRGASETMHLGRHPWTLGFLLSWAYGLVKPFQRDWENTKSSGTRMHQSGLTDIRWFKSQIATCFIRWGGLLHMVNAKIRAQWHSSPTETDYQYLIFPA